MIRYYCTIIMSVRFGVSLSFFFANNPELLLVTYPHGIPILSPFLVNSIPSGHL
jgi:hypothetical protein